MGKKTSCTDWGANQCRKFIVLDIGQYRIILSADTVSEVRQLLSQKRR